MKFVAQLLLVPIALYRRLISPLLPRHCRFEPTCSQYGTEAITVHGPIKGTWLTLKRIARCHPWGGSGLDPVPPPAVPATERTA